MDLNRRQFLVKTSSSLVAGWALANGLRPSSAAAEEVNSIPFANPVFLMKYPQSVTDFRPVVNKTATTVIFERTISGSTKLYSLDLTNPSAKPVLFAKGLNAQSFRPDWSWQTGEVVFMNNNGIYLASASGAHSLITGTAGMTYPTWYPDGATLAVYNNQPKTGEPVPRTSKMDLTGKVLQDVLANDNTWAGFASVNQTSPNLIAFAGQVVIPKGTYDQNKNYIWLTNTSTTPPTVTTLAPNAPKDHFDPNFQGRAPWYSPDGKWIVFESNRFNSKGLYSIFIQIADGSSAAVRVTDPRWDAQHAKFYPNGTELVVTVLQKFGGTNRGIAKLDVSAFVS
jgi:Tol biopolymer transport system component